MLPPMQGFLDEATRRKVVILTLWNMGFCSDSVERVFLFTTARTVEECLPYLVLNDENLMEHKFIAP